MQVHLIPRSLVVIFSALFLASCASIEARVHDAAQAFEDSIRGYRVQFHSIPAGATISCNGEELGVAPHFRYRQLTREQKDLQMLEMGDCYALWHSGARTDIQASVPLDVFPRFVNLVAERPDGAPDLDMDEDFGKKILAQRQKVLDDAAAAVAGLAGLGIGLYQFNKASKSSASMATIPPSYIPSHGVSGAGGIKWNWVQAGMPNFAMPKSGPALIPVVPASSCVGAIVLGQCHGEVIVTTAVKSYCSGKMLNGKCIGTVLSAD